MKKIGGSCILGGWMMLSAMMPAWAQNQTTPPQPAAATPSTNALNTGSSAPSPVPTSANVDTNPPVPGATPAPAPSSAVNNNAVNNNGEVNIDAITKTLRKATSAVKAKLKADDKKDDAANQAATNNSVPPLTAPPASATNTAPAPLTAEQLQQKAFDNALNNVFPLSPEQIQQVMQRMNNAQEAGRAPPEPDPKAVVKIEDVPLDPGVQPPLIRVATGYVTTVNILDVTGQPWPIQDVVVGGNFQVTGPNDAQVLRIIPQTRFGRGNLSVRLVGLSTPITFRVESGGPEVYYRYDARIAQSGPDAKQPLIDHGFTGQAGDPTLMGVLAGIAPQDAKKLALSGTDSRTKAWKINGQIYLRTPLTLLSPGWDSSVRSADGTSVYVLSESPVLMLSDNGQMVRAGVDIPPDDPFHTNDLKAGKVTVTVPDPAAAQAAAVAAGQNPTPGSITPAGATAAANAAQAAAAAGAPGTPPNGNNAQTFLGTAAPTQSTTTTTPGQSTTTTTTTTNPNVTKLPSGVTIYTNGASPPVETKTNIPINVNVGGNGS